MSTHLSRALAAAAAALSLAALPNQADAQYSPPRPRGPLPDQAASGKFRFTINGFVVNAASRDNLLDVDGVGDEVFASAAVVVVNNAQGLSTHTATVRSRTYGEDRFYLGTRNQVFAGRVNAGFGTPRGGLRSGNSFPRTTEPWRLTTTPTTDQLPLEVWCGTLTEGQNAAIIVPTIWESDNGQGPVFKAFATWGNEVATAIAKDPASAQVAEVLGSALGGGAGAAGTAATAGINAVTAGARIAIGGVMRLADADLIGGEADRPIGGKKLEQNGRTFYEYTPEHRLLLNYRTADFSTRKDGAGSIGGLPPGVFALGFRDDPFYQADYTLYVQVERIDGKQCAYEEAAAKKK